MFSRVGKRVGSLSLLACWFTIAACTRANATGKSEHDRTTGEQSKSRSPGGDLRQLRPDELTDELIGVSERLLEQHADAPLGTEVPFSHGGRRYVARIEEHVNATNNPKRPPGKHKGVTLFTPDR
jgi:hypothetical protein